MGTERLGVDGQRLRLPEAGLGVGGRGLVCGQA
jgi:hypothetical protein